MSNSSFRGVSEIKDFEGESLKLKGEGTLSYRLYFDERCQLYIQIAENNLTTKKPGTYSSELFSLRKYVRASLSRGALPLPVIGRKMDGTEAASNDTNMPGYLKAVIRNLLGEQ